MSDPELLRVGPGLVAVISSPKPDSASTNEDAAAVVPVDQNSGVLAVADGVGGSKFGEVASRIALETLSKAVNKAQADRSDLRAAILDGFEQANRAVLDLGQGAATTLAVVEIRDNTYRTYHVGDSFVLVIGQRGKLKLQTVPHSPVGYAIESGLLDEHEAMLHDDRHFVSNLIGSPDMRIEIGSPATLAPRDTLLIGSDGLCDNLHTTEIIERSRKGPLTDVVDVLATDSKLRMQQRANGHPSKPDDFTCVAFRLSASDA